MSIGAKWLRRAEQAAAAHATQILAAAERELGELLPGARIERGVGELRIGARRVVQRWLVEPALRFLLWKNK